MPIRVLVAGLIVVATVGLGGTPAAAHGPAPGGDTVLAQTIAGMEVTLAVRRTGQVPGPLRVDLIPHAPVRDVTIAVAIRSGGSATATTAGVRFEQGTARTYPVALTVREEGPHWLELRAGDEVSRLPFRVEVTRAAASELWVSGAFGVAALMLFAAFGTAALGARAVAVVLGGAAGAALVVGATLAVTPPPGTVAAVPEGRPYAQAKIFPVPEKPAVGEALTLRVTLVDGSTGRPLDDLVPHHQALAHMVVTSADGAAFHHLHPRRTEAGQLEVRLTPDRSGPYRVDVEFEREDAGSQLVSGRFVAAGPAPGAAAEKATLPEAVAGRPVSIRIEAGSGRLQPWLGMAGHLIVRDSRGTFLGHAHELGSMTTTAAPPDDTVPAYPPVLRFAFTFPEPGRYFVWVQYAHDLRIHTVPYVVDVRAEAAA